MNMKVTVGHANADFNGADDLTIQAAIEYVTARGGGTVELKAGTYRLNNSVRLRSGISLVGAGPDTVLMKEPSVTVPLIEESDWYEARVTVADVSAFRVGGGVLITGQCPHTGQDQHNIHTILAIEGNTLHLDNRKQAAEHPVHLGNFWLTHAPAASTLFSLVTANWVTDIRVADLRVDGNRGKSAPLNGNYAAALFFQDCERVLIHNVQSGNIESDALSFQIVHDLTVENSVFHDAIQGVHPGSGSQRPIIRHNTIRRCTRHGLSWCWGVKHGLAEGNTIEDCPTGISIGHRDTDNVMRGNIVRRCSEGGLVYRDDPPARAAHNNLIADNLFEDIGTLEKPGYGIDMSGPVSGNVLRGNRIRCTRAGLMKAGIRIGPNVAGVVLERNVVEGIARDVEDLRASAARGAR